MSMVCKFVLKNYRVNFQIEDAVIALKRRNGYFLKKGDLNTNNEYDINKKIIMGKSIFCSQKLEMLKHLLLGHEVQTKYCQATPN